LWRSRHLGVKLLDQIRKYGEDRAVLVSVWYMPVMLSAVASARRCPFAGVLRAPHAVATRRQRADQSRLYAFRT